MDLLTAFSLAGTVIKFVDFGTRLLGNVGELYKSSTGSLAINGEIALTTCDLRAVIVKLRESIPVTADPSSDGPWGAFAKICDEAASVADELVKRLSGLKVKDAKNPKLRSLQVAVKSLWSHKEISGLRKRLSGFREALETGVLLSISESCDNEAIRNSARFDRLDTATQQIVTSILVAQNKTTHELSRNFQEGMNALTITLAQLLSRLVSLNQDNHHQDRETILDEISRRKGLNTSREQSITAAIEMLSISDDAEQKLRCAIQRSIIQSLQYLAMTNHYEDLDEAHHSTFEWAFENSTDEQLSWDNLSDWMKTGVGVYWASGEAGAGKSTLMKHIFDSPRTKHYLRRWSEGPLCIAPFFFWNTGTREQRSQLGLLRALLFQILHQYPELVPIILLDVWAAGYSRAVRGDWGERDLGHTWSLRQLMAAFKVLETQKVASVKICLFVDGLDEFDGDHEQVGRLCKELTSSGNLKVCLSSRPWVVFEGLFKDCPKLRLQNLTHKDITSYVTDKLGGNEAFQTLAKVYPKEAPELIHYIVDKADGVFLWVQLVVQSLLCGLRSMDEMSDLWNRLRFPKGARASLFEIGRPHRATLFALGLEDFSDTSCQ